MSCPPPDGIQWPRRSTVQIGEVRCVGPAAWLVGLPLLAMAALCEAVASAPRLIGWALRTIGISRVNASWEKHSPQEGS